MSFRQSTTARLDAERRAEMLELNRKELNKIWRGLAVAGTQCFMIERKTGHYAPVIIRRRMARGGRYKVDFVDTPAFSCAAKYQDLHLIKRNKYHG